MKNFYSWTEKYRPSKFLEIKGHDGNIEIIKKFLSNFPEGKRAILLNGPAGIGKTSIAYVIQKELNVEIFELNASDFRNKEQLEAKLKPASEQSSLFKKGKILLVDEVDGLSSTDKGGMSELIELIETTQFPMIITANHIWDAKFGDLRKKCIMISLKEIDYKTISLILQEIARKEKLNVDNEIIMSLAIRCKGDVRAAINDLQTLTSDPDFILNYLSLDERNKEIDIFNALKLIFKQMVNEETLRVYDSVDVPLDKIFLWLEENIPYEYSGEELFKAYELLSLADVFRGRIQSQRHWRFLIYQNIFLSAGISLSKSRPRTGFTQYKKPSRILKIWMNNENEKYKKSIVAKYAALNHCSKAKAVKEFYLLKHLVKKDEIQRELDLSDNEINYIKKIN